MKLSPQVCKQLFPEQLVEKISHLASGRMGSVYKVTLNNGEVLCVKILTRNHPTKLQDSRGWKLAYDYLDFDFKSCEDNQYFYFTIPYFDGQLFHNAIQYNLKSRFEIIKSLIIATKEIHQKELIHRDIKCNNIIIEKNTVRIIDFGRSVIFHDSSTEGGLQLPGQGTLFPNVKRIFQPYTAPEYFKNDGSTIGFYSDYYSIAQLCRFLISEYPDLAKGVLNTEGEARIIAFEDFSKNIDSILRDNQFDPKFNEPNKIYSDEYILYKKIMFFITQIFARLFNLTFQFSVSKSTEQDQTVVSYNGPRNISSMLFKLNNSNSKDTNNLTNFLPRNGYSL